MMKNNKDNISKSPNAVWHNAKVSKQDRWLKNSHKSALIWLTGLSASGKSSIAVELDRSLYDEKINTFVLDGDNVRHGLCKDLGFSEEDRRENMRRVGEVAKLLVDAGILTIAAFISPYASDRLKIRELFEKGEFIEVYLKCDLSVCEARDPKGFYRKARLGEIKNYTGISAPYEAPENSEIILETDQLSISESVESIRSYLKIKGIIL